MITTPVIEALEWAIYDEIQQAAHACEKVGQEDLMSEVYLAEEYDMDIRKELDLVWNSLGF
jgi:hypothetical protein